MRVQSEDTKVDSCDQIASQDPKVDRCRQIAPQNPETERATEYVQYTQLTRVD